MAGLPTVHHDDVEGVTTFWVDSGRPTLAAVLVVRTGLVDETLPTTGWSHLVEHLALHDRRQGTLSVNGSTSLLHTQLQAHGEVESVAGFLAETTGWLAAPDLSRLEHEAGVLRAEAEYRGIGDPATALLNRYGARGAGLAGYAEPGLARATAESVGEFVAARFTSGNAVLVLDGPPPAGLRLHLPPGPRGALPDPPPGDASIPAAYVTRGAAVLSGELPRTQAAVFVPPVLQDVLQRDLREGAGGAYSPWSSYEPVGRTTAVAFAGSDVAQSLLPTVVRHVLAGLQTLRSEGPRPGVVEDLTAAAVQALRDPYQASAFAYRSAVAHVAGEPVLTPEEVIEEAASVRPEDVAQLVADFADTLLLGVPADAAWEDPMPMLRMPPVAPVTSGRRHRSRNLPLVRDVLVVGSEGTAVHQDGDWYGVATEDVAAMFASEDGARTLVRPDGWTVTVEPTLWARGSEATAALDALVPPDRVLTVPGRETERLPRPMPWWRRWGLAASGPLLVVLGLVLAFVGTAFVGLPGLALGAFLVYLGIRVSRETLVPGRPSSRVPGSPEGS